MHSYNLATALRTWAETAPDSLYNGSSWVIACWEGVAGDLSVTGLLAATYALDTDAEAPAPAPSATSIPATWLEYALDFDARVFDLVTKRPAILGGLAGVGLVAAGPGPRGSAVVFARIAADKAAFTVELHRYADAVGRCEIGDPLWWDQQHVFEPLERYLAAACGRPPALPAEVAPEGSARHSTVLWAGPC